MAITHAQPLLLPLLLSLFFLPSALNATKFHACNPLRHYPVDVKTVEISPDPVKRSTNGNFTITGSTSIGIPDGAIVTIGLTIPEVPVAKKKYSLCDLTACPVAPGPIVLTFSNVFNKQELSGWGYYVSISITVENSEDPMMCVGFICTITGDTSLFRQAIK